MTLSRLTLQRLPRLRDKVLAVGQLVALRQVDGAFSSASVQELAKDLRIPMAGDVSRAIRRLRDDELVIELSARRWAVTPEGEQALLQSVGSLTPTVTDPGNATGGAEFGAQRHQVIPAALAPEPLAGAIARLLEDHPFEQNVLLITRFPSGEQDPLWPVIKAARQVCGQHELELHLAGEKNADPLLFNNVAGYMWACRFGLALFEAYGDPPKKPAALNQNLLIEVGGMLATRRRCAILRDPNVEDMPTDLVGHIFHRVSLRDIVATTANLHRALVADFGTSPCSTCPSS